MLAPPPGVHVNTFTGFGPGHVDVAPPRDVTGDGVPDILFGLGDENRALLFPGEVPTEILQLPLDINGPLPRGATEFLGGPGGSLGHAVTLGDVNGDGFADIISGDPDASPTPELTGAGRMVIILGHGGLPSVIDTGDPENNSFFQFNGRVPGAQFGTSVTSGDLDGDGMDDVAAGANYDSLLSELGGINFLLYGTTLIEGNLPPVAVDDIAETDEDTPVITNILENDFDPELDPFGLVGDPIIISGFGNENETVSFQGDNLLFDPNGGYEALGPGQSVDVIVEYEIEDAWGSWDFGLVTITVNGVNDPPVADDDEAVTDEDTSILIDALDGDTDVDGGPLTIQATGIVGADMGEALIENNMIRFNPGTDFDRLQAGESEVVQVFYQVSDGAGGVDTGTVFVTVNGVNDPPIANPDSARTMPDTSIVIPVLANDTDVDGGPLMLLNAFPPTSGTVVANGDGTVTYTPAPGFTGFATFEYRVGDGNGGIADGAVTVEVNANRPPIAVDDADMTDEDTVLTIAIADLLVNDSDPDGDAISFVDFTYIDGGPDVDGSMTRVGDNLIYTPDPNFNGSDFFTYRITDGEFFDTGFVDIEVKPVNDDPVAEDDAAMTDEDVAVTIAIADLLSNDKDVDGDTIMFDGFTYFDFGPTVDGSMTRVGNNLIYTPDPDFNGADFFTYDISDGNGGTATGTVDITVKPINDDPVANDDMAMTNEDTALTISIASLLSNDTDVDDDVIMFDGIFLGASDGTVQQVGNNLIYTPDLNFNGMDSFVYAIKDGNGGTDVAFVDITVKPINDKPVAVNDAFGTNEDTPLVITFAQLLGNDTDPDLPPDQLADALDVSFVGGAGRGNVVVGATGVTYTPDANFNGNDSFTYTVRDLGPGPGPRLTDIGVVNITVTPVNDPPFIIPPQLQLFTLPDIPVSYLVTAGDVDGDALTITADGAMNGTLTASPELGLGGTTYTPDTAFEGTDGFAVQATDPAGATATQQVTVEVGQPPDADDFLTFLSDGFVGGFGGSGQVVGNSGFQDVTIFDVPGLTTLDASFNGGGDILRMPGLASDWFVFRQGSSTLATDGDTFVLIPVGINGLAIVFDNFTLNLRFDQAENTFKIGEQAFGSDMFVQITAIEELTSLPTGGDPAAPAVLFVAETASVTLSGRVDVFGTQSGEMFSLMGGDITIDASSNSGGDIFSIPDFAFDGTGQRLGSSFFFDGPTTDLLVPVGLEPSTLVFPDSSRELLFDPNSGMISLGGQLFGNSPEALMMIA